MMVTYALHVISCNEFIAHMPKCYVGWRSQPHMLISLEFHVTSIQNCVVVVVVSLLQKGILIFVGKRLNAIETKIHLSNCIYVNEPILLLENYMRLQLRLRMKIESFFLFPGIIDTMTILTWEHIIWGSLLFDTWIWDDVHTHTHIETETDLWRVVWNGCEREKDR